jgi:coenzyme F420-dependent glucose-6-phosphate dehydrogenase
MSSALRIGFHPLADLISPQRVLEESVLATKSGFKGIFIPDHFHPWNVAEGTPFAWTLVAAVAERTQDIRVGTAVTCPTLRYNPAIVAQAFATLGATYEGRIFLGVGTGEALNEVPTGNLWPKGAERLARLRESITVIRLLWSQEYVSFDGRYYKLRKANLFTRPRNPVPIYVSGYGPRATELAGTLGDGWITGNLPEWYVSEALKPALEESLKKSGRGGLGYERVMELLVSYDKDIDRAVESSRVIAGAMEPEVQQNAIYDPREIKAYADKVEKEDLTGRILVCDEPDDIVEKLESLAKLGFTWVEIASMGPDVHQFMDAFAKRVFPHLAQSPRQ